MSTTVYNSEITTLVQYVARRALLPILSNINLTWNYKYRSHRHTSVIVYKVTMTLKSRNILQNVKKYIYIWCLHSYKKHIISNYCVWPPGRSCILVGVSKYNVLPSSGYFFKQYHSTSLTQFKKIRRYRLIY